jgi:hypothetical protein
MALRPTCLRLLLCGATLVLGLGAAVTANAQLGSVNNPPPQNLFNFDGTPKPLNNGLGTMAERRRELARSKARARRPVHRHTTP